MMASPDYDLHKFFDVSPDMLCIAGLDGYFKRVNPAFERVLGWSTDELLHRPYLEFVHPDDVPATLAEVAKLASGYPTLSFENRYRSADGTFRQLHWTAYPESETGLLYAVARDVTAERLEQERFRLALEASPSAMVMVDHRGSIVLLNRAAETLFGYDRDELIDRPIELLVPTRFRRRHPRHRKRFVSQPTARPMGAGRDLTARRRDGTEFPVEIGLNPIVSAAGTFVLSAIVDLSDRKRAQRQLEAANRQLARLATTDPLTGLKNHGAFMSELESQLQFGLRAGRSLSLLMLDVDRFKEYNDAFGHPAGDEILRQVATLLRDTARRSDIVARYGGEEFAIILPETDGVGAVGFGERFRAAIEDCAWPRRTITVSVGAATIAFPGSGLPEGRWSSDLIAAADQALYHSKTGGRNRVTHASDVVQRA